MSLSAFLTEVRPKTIFLVTFGRDGGVIIQDLPHAGPEDPVHRGAARVSFSAWFLVAQALPTAVLGQGAVVLVLELLGYVADALTAAHGIHKSLFELGHNFAVD